MPSLQPMNLRTSPEDWSELMKQLNYIIQDIYNYIDTIQGVDNKQFTPNNMQLPDGTYIPDHDHTTVSTGGDYPWADLIDADIAYLKALVTAILVDNLLDKTANETIAGTWSFANTGLTIKDTNGSHVLVIKPGSDLTGNKTFTIVTGDADRTLTLAQAHIVDASESHNITDPGDSPVSADALRDDLVTNTIPAIEAALNALGVKVNAILARLETSGISLTV